MSEIDLPILKANIIDIAPNVLVMGDPNRVSEAAKILDEAREVGNYREYLTITGVYHGKPVTMCSHGVGASGASVCFQDLFRAGVKNVIRAGTCGAMQSFIEDGDMVIGTAAVRQDGTSQYFVPPEFPAFADRKVIDALEESGLSHNAKLHSGMVLTKANFAPELLPDDNKLWARAGVLAIEMELAVLLVLASLKNITAGGIFVSDGNVFIEKKYDPHRTVVKEGVEKMLSIALDALVMLSD